MARINYFAGGELDRASRLRADAAWLAARRDDPRSRYVAVWRGQCLVNGDDPPRAVLLPPEALAELDLEAVPVALLGVIDGAARFAVDLSADDDPAAGGLAGRAAFCDLRAVGGQMPVAEAQLLAHARGLMYWHSRHLFCGVCGGPTEAGDGGYVRICGDPACAAHHFPRTDPAVIMLVRDGDRCLLGRQAVWPDGMYSALAGFVEPGESLEEAVAREVKEETGVEVANVRYHSSQPWPFPSSLMLGFDAEAVTTDIDLDCDELEDACWFHRDELRNLPKGIRLPRPVSIARRLVEDWLAGSIG